MEDYLDEFYKKPNYNDSALMQNFSNRIIIGKNCGNVNRTCDNLSLMNNMRGLEHDMGKLRAIKESVEDIVGHELNIML